MALSVYALAAECGVGIGEACDRAGIARSTPPRWRSGTKPRPHQLARLRAAILAIAQERGMLPPTGLPQPEPTIHELARQASQERARILGRLDDISAEIAVIKAALGAA